MKNGISTNGSSDGSAAPKSDARAPETLGVVAIKPKERHGWEAVRLFIYDKETGAYFSRTPKSWAEIILFYIVFFACLVAFWFILFEVIFFRVSLVPILPKHKVN